MTAPTELARAGVAHRAASRSPAERVRAASSTTFTVYLVETLLAVAPAWLVTVALAGTGLAHVPDPGSAEWLEALERLASGGFRPTLVATGTALLLGTAAGPWLTMGWLRALGSPMAWTRALRAGLRLYLPAVRVSLLVGTATLVACALAALLPFGAHLLVAGSPDARMHDLAVLAAGAPAVSLLVAGAFMHDIARARLATATEPRAVAAVRDAARAADAPLLGAFLLWTSLGVLALALGHALTHAAGGPGPVRALAVAVIGQVAVLARLLLRARWLAVALDGRVPAELQLRGADERGKAVRAVTAPDAAAD